MHFRRGFFWRAGCFVVFLLISVFVFLFGLLAILAYLFGNLSLPGVSLNGVIALGLLILLIGLVFFFWVGRGLRRISIPVGELVDASQRVAEGDYSARVKVQGPREVRSVANAFNSMAERLQDTDFQRRSLLADVTHELSTPLTVIQGNLEAMLDGVYPADEANLRSLLEESQLLSRLVEDLRTLSLAESGALQLRIEQLNLETLVRETTGAFRAQAMAAGVEFILTPPQEVILVEVDGERMRQVISNLLSNALRYSPQGGKIRVAWRSADQQNLAAPPGRVKIAISDDGPGIKPEDLPHVFDRFYKTSDSGGTGLGLSIAKSLVEAHSGSLTAETSPGRGTTMRLSLPLVRTQS